MILVALLFTSLFGGVNAVTCKDMHDFTIPWFAAYKMPKMDGETVGSKDGLGFYYLDYADRTQFKTSPVALNGSGHAIYNTLNQYYQNTQDPNFLHVFYNDEPVNTTENPIFAEKAEVEYGHNKGILLFDNASDDGVWIIHSVPKFPPADHYEYPNSGTEYGQTFLCLTVDTRTLGQIGTALYYNHAWVYSANIPDWATNMAPDLVKIVNGQYNADPTDVSLVQNLQVSGATSNMPKFQVFAKTHLFQNDLWGALVAPTVKQSLEVETWRRGYLIAQNCTVPYPIYDAQTMQIGNTAEFKYTKDHSKFARSIDAEGKTVCIGDINRMTSQFHRGGGAVCITDADLWNAYSVFRQLPSC